MPTRIDIELTSAGADGSWTWRATGAREPKGTLDGSLLPADAAVGDQLKAETEKDLDGIRVLSVVTAKAKESRGGMLELLPSGDFEPVTQQRARRERSDGPRGDRPRRDRGDRPDRGNRGDRRDRDQDRDRGPRREPSDGAPRRDGEGGDREDRRRHRPHFTPPPELPQRPKPKRLRPGKQHRTALLDSIPEEQRPVAELALQGLPAVRQRVREDNARLVGEGKPPMPEATVLKMAEEMLPRLRVADWLDRAEAAQRQLDHLDLRDLRSVVAAADDPVVARDESTRALTADLKAALLTKQDEELNLWLTDIEANVDIGRVVRALRLSAMPPKAGVPFPAQLGAKLGEATTAALGPDDPPDRWVAVLEAAAFAPVRNLVTPSAAPTQRNDELTATVTRLAPLLPQVAALFDITADPKAATPKPLRPAPRKRETPNKPAGRADAPTGRPPQGERRKAGGDRAPRTDRAADDASGGSITAESEATVPVETPTDQASSADAPAPEPAHEVVPTDETAGPADEVVATDEVAGPDEAGAPDEVAGPDETAAPTESSPPAVEATDTSAVDDDTEPVRSIDEG